MQQNRLVSAKCPRCSSIDYFEVPQEGMVKRVAGSSIKQAFPDLPEERQKQLVDGICPECRKKPT